MHTSRFVWVFAPNQEYMDEGGCRKCHIMFKKEDAYTEAGTITPSYIHLGVSIEVALCSINSIHNNKTSAHKEKMQGQDYQ